MGWITMIDQLWTAEMISNEDCEMNMWWLSQLNPNLSNFEVAWKKCFLFGGGGGGRCAHLSDGCKFY